MWVVVGLGNPGPSYLHTRHNAGFAVAKRLAHRAGVRLQPAFGGLVGQARVRGHALSLCMPMTYMNRSGGPVSQLLQALGIEPQRLVVVHDDLDLEFGTIRCKRQGGHGGHNGLRDIVEQVGRGFVRVRFGIGRPAAGLSVPDHVLGVWSSAEQQHLTPQLEVAVSAVEAVVTAGVDFAMNQFNVRVPPALGHTPSKQQ